MATYYLVQRSGEKSSTVLSSKVYDGQNITVQAGTGAQSGGSVTTVVTGTGLGNGIAKKGIVPRTLIRPDTALAASQDISDWAINNRVLYNADGTYKQTELWHEYTSVTLGGPGVMISGSSFYPLGKLNSALVTTNPLVSDGSGGSTYMQSLVVSQGTATQFFLNNWTFVWKSNQLDIIDSGVGDVGIFYVTPLANGLWQICYRARNGLNVLGTSGGGTLGVQTIAQPKPPSKLLVDYDAYWPLEASVAWGQRPVSYTTNYDGTQSAYLIGPQNSGSLHPLGIATAGSGNSLDFTDSYAWEILVANTVAQTITFRIQSTNGSNKSFSYLGNIVFAADGTYTTSDNSSPGTGTITATNMGNGWVKLRCTVAGMGLCTQPDISVYSTGGATNAFKFGGIQYGAYSFANPDPSTGQLAATTTTTTAPYLEVQTQAGGEFVPYYENGSLVTVSSGQAVTITNPTFSGFRIASPNNATTDATYPVFVSSGRDFTDRLHLTPDPIIITAAEQNRREEGRVELWTQPLRGNGEYIPFQAMQRIAIARSVQSASASRKEGQPDVLTLVISVDDPISVQATYSDLIRTQRVGLGTSEMWKITHITKERGTDNELKCTINAESLYSDLNNGGLVTEVLDTTVNTTFGRVNQTATEAIQLALSGYKGGVTFYLGRIEPTLIAEIISVDKDSPSSLLRKLEPLFNARLVFFWDDITQAYFVHLLNVDDLPPSDGAVVRYEHNLITVARALDGGTGSTRFYGEAANNTTLAASVWQLTATADPNSFWIHDQGMQYGPIGAPGWLVGYRLRLAGTTVSGTRINSTTGSYLNRYGQVTLPAGHGFVGGNLVEFCTADGARAAYIDHPTATGLHGVRARMVSVTDIGEYENILQNPTLSDSYNAQPWENVMVGSFPPRWEGLTGSETITPDNDPLYVAYGTVSAHVTASSGGGIQSLPFRWQPTAERPIFVCNALVHTIVGRVRMYLVNAATPNGPFYPLKGTVYADTAKGPAPYQLSCTEGAMPPGDYRVVFVADGAAEFVVDACTVTPSYDDKLTDITIGQGPTALWREVVRTALNETEPFTTYTVSAVPLFMLDPITQAHQRIRLGYAMSIMDPELQIGVSVRVTGLEERLDRLENSCRIELSTDRNDIYDFRNPRIYIKKTPGIQLRTYSDKRPEVTTIISTRTELAFGIHLPNGDSLTGTVAGEATHPTAKFASSGAVATVTWYNQDASHSVSAYYVDISGAPTGGDTVTVTIPAVAGEYALSIALLGVPSLAIAGLESIPNVTVSNPTDGQVLSHTATGWTNLTLTPDIIGAQPTLPSGTNGQVLSIANNQLVFTAPSGGGGATLARATSSVTTASLAANATENDDIATGKSGVLMHITTSQECRVRVYTTAAQRTSDAARAVGTNPTGMHGVLLDMVTDASTLSYILSPLVTYANGEATPVSTLPIAITNLGATGAVTVTFTYLALEA